MCKYSENQDRGSRMAESKRPVANPTKNALLRENERLKVQLESLRRSRLASNLTSMWAVTVKWAAIAFTTGFCVKQLAGQVTVVDAAVDVCASLSDILAELAPSWGVLLLMVGIMTFAIQSNRRYRRLNANLVERHGTLTKRYEAMTDPDRSSSGLGPTGQTHERDEL